MDTSNLNINRRDILLADQLRHLQRAEFTRNGLFRTGLYTLLSASQLYETQLRVYDLLLITGFDYPESILSDDPNRHEDLRRIIFNMRFPNERLKRLYNFAEWWMNTDFHESVIEDASNGRFRGFELREELVASRGTGIGYKCASLFMTMCGYQDVVPIDIWMIRFLESRGYDIARTTGGISRRQYLESEKVFSAIAAEYEVTPARFQEILWIKLRAGKSLDQLSLDF